MTTLSSCPQGFWQFKTFFRAASVMTCECGCSSPVTQRWGSGPLPGDWCVTCGGRGRRPRLSCSSEKVRQWESLSWPSTRRVSEVDPGVLPAAPHPHFFPSWQQPWARLFAQFSRSPTSTLLPNFTARCVSGSPHLL